ncbi:tyrosine-type recombinase/integrase [Chelativorans sp. AA-79]|uniref:tyrosine-type recombinase/integrase n=1 Tax=Chelativorans sp. AA-79 TaxID=3028735 RepID=UPI003211E72D
MFNKSSRSQKPKGIAKATKRLADGSTRTYLYAWRGGPRLFDLDGRALTVVDDRLWPAYERAVASVRAIRPQNLHLLVDEFRDSSEYKKLSDKSKRGYDRYLKLIEADDIALMNIQELQDPEARGHFKKWRDTMADKPRTADYAWVTLARVLSVAKDNGRIKVNVCERGRRLYKADRAEKVWQEGDINAVLAVASAPIRMALMMALWTGQREGDLLRATWNAYDGKRLRVRQGKTGARVTVPVGEPLRVLLNAAMAERAKKNPKVVDMRGKDASTILVNTRGRPWTEDGFRASWSAAYKKAGLPTNKEEKLNFHDLRGTAVTRLALAGCNNAEIASITGHSLRDVEAILDAHYLGGRGALADQAMAKLEHFISSEDGASHKSRRKERCLMRGASFQPRVSFTLKETEAFRLERLKEAADDREMTPEELTKAFGPGSFGCHEAMEGASIFMDSVDRHLCEHPAVLANPDWYRLASEAQTALFNLYQAIAEEHIPASHEQK